MSVFKCNLAALDPRFLGGYGFGDAHAGTDLFDGCGCVNLPSGMRKQPAQVRSEQTVEAILNAADLVFAELGVQAATTTVIADRAGLSVGSLYRFYQDKAALAEALADRYLGDLAKVFIEVDAMVGGGDPEMIPAAVHTMVYGVAELHRTYPGYFAVVQHLNPARADSPAHHVRTAQIQALSAWFALVPAETDVASHGRIAEFLIDTTRVLVERVPLDEPQRSAHLDDVVLMLTPYLRHHLG